MNQGVPPMDCIRSVSTFTVVGRAAVPLLFRFPQPPYQM